MTDLTARLVLPPDLVMTPVRDLPTQIRRRVSPLDDSVTLTRLGTRLSTRVVDRNGADLLREFSTPKLIAEAILCFSRARRQRAESTLMAAFPFLADLVENRFLLGEGDPELLRAGPTLAPADRVGSYDVVRCVHLIEDCEVYRGSGPDGQPVAIKIVRSVAGADAPEMLRLEATVLRRLGGTSAPALLHSGAVRKRRFVVMSWCDGQDPTVPAAQARGRGLAGRPDLVRLAARIAGSYAHLHRNEVVHGDVHTGNILIGPDDAVTILDFCLARVRGVESSSFPAGGVAFYLEPERAAQLRIDAPLSSPDPLGEQYAVAALLYYLFTGEQYLDFPLDNDRLADAILTDPPRRFVTLGQRPWPEVEAVLARALAKDPRQRYGSMTEFAAALASLAIERDAPRVARSARSRDLVNAVLRSLQPYHKGERFARMPSPASSVYYGGAGTASALLRIGALRQDADLLALADLWLTRAEGLTRYPSRAFISREFEITPELVGTISPFHAASGPLLVRASLAHRIGDSDWRDRAVLEFIRKSRQPSLNPELTMGQAGPLLAAARLFPHVGPRAKSRLRTLGNELTRRLTRRMKRLGTPSAAPRLPNLGMAHGWAGMLYALLAWQKESGGTLSPAVSQWLEDLAGCAEWSRRSACWPWVTGETVGYMPGWCNGSAGFVMLWIVAHEVTSEECYLTLAEGAGWDTWEAEGTAWDLCCGLTGRAYGLHALYRHTGDGGWRRRAHDLAQLATEAWRSGVPPSAPTHRHCLFRGDTGLALMLTELETDEAAFPVVERIL